MVKVEILMESYTHTHTHTLRDSILVHLLFEFPKNRSSLIDVIREEIFFFFLLRWLMLQQPFITQTNIRF